MSQTIPKLIALCKEYGIKGYNKKNKADLITMIELHKHPQQEQQEQEASKQQKVEKVDTYTTCVLRTQYNLHKEYVIRRKQSGKDLDITFRFPCIPEDISENIVKFIIHKNGDKTSSWNCGGDLLSKIEGKQECKCFTSDGPPSFTPSSEWDIIYFLDARKWLDDVFTLYRVNLRRTSEEWKKIKVSKTQTFDDQCQQGRRPRITWESLYPQITEYTTKIYEGKFEDILE